MENLTNEELIKKLADSKNKLVILMSDKDADSFLQEMQIESDRMKSIEKELRKRELL